MIIAHQIILGLFALINIVNCLTAIDNQNGPEFAGNCIGLIVIGFLFIVGANCTYN